MSKMTILGPKANHPGCGFEEWRAGALRGCGQTSFVKAGNVYLCPEHAKYALSAQGEHYELFAKKDPLAPPLAQKAFLALLEAAMRPAPAPAESSSDD